MWNVTLAKSTPITERVRFRLEAQAGSASRNMQVAGRIRF